jgi:hypothetical protein
MRKFTTVAEKCGTKEVERRFLNNGSRIPLNAERLLQVWMG